MSVHSRPSIQYQDGMELRDRKMTKDCTQPLRIGNKRALNGCAGRLFWGRHTAQPQLNTHSRIQEIANYSGNKCHAKISESTCFNSF